MVFAISVGVASIFQTSDLLYYSATLMVDPDVEKMDRYLKHPPRERFSSSRRWPLPCAGWPTPGSTTFIAASSHAASTPIWNVPAAR